jgi:proteasome accessory factor C
VSHDTDKLIRQLSLVAFLMAERRAVTARDIKGSVEGYQEMSDEAFARRFYSDRAELIALGVPLHSQRDEYTGEELYNMRSESYFLPPLELTDDELAALQTCLYLLEGKFAYAEPLRLALQNLALGRPGFAESPTDTAMRVEVLDPEYSAEMQGRLGKLEGAISKQRTVKFPYWSISRDQERERTVNPYALFQDAGAWYVVGEDLDVKAERTFRVSRIRGEIRFATRRERDFRLPPDFEVDRYRGRPPWQIGEPVGEARIEVGGDTAWWVERTYGDSGKIEDGVFVTEYSSLPLLASWVLRQDGRAVPQAPEELRKEVARSLRLVRERHEGKPDELAAETAKLVEEAVERPAAPVAPERFAVLQALLAYLLDRCGEDSQAEFPAQELVERFHIPPEALEEHLSLLNLVNFGGGCYAVYAELDGDTASPHAARGARDPARARVRRADDRRRRALAARAGALEAGGDLRRVRARSDARAARAAGRGGPRRHAQPGPTRAPAGRGGLPQGGRGGGLDAPGRAVLARAKAAVLVRPHVGPHARRGALVPPRPDAERPAPARAVRAT